VTYTAERRRGHRVLFLLATSLLLLVAAAAPRTAAAVSQGPPESPGTQQVMFVGNNWEGTADIVDARTFRRLALINIIPDKAQEEAAVFTDPNPARPAFFLGIRLLIGEGHDQYVDDMFTTHDGTLVAVSRPSFADVVGISLRTRQIVWEFELPRSASDPTAGMRTDHMAVSPDGERLLVSDSTGNVVHELDIRTGQKTGEFPSGDSPHENNYSADGKLVYHASIGRVYTPTDRFRPILDSTKGHRVFELLDADTLQTIRRWGTEPGEEPSVADETACFGRPDIDESAVRPMALSPDEQFAYIQVSFFHGFIEWDLRNPTRKKAPTDACEGRVLRVADLPVEGDGAGPRETYVLDSAHHGIAMNPQGTKLCVAGTMSDYAALVSRQNFADFKIFRAGDKPYWSTTGPVGNVCWVSFSMSDKVGVFDYDSERQVADVPVGDADSSTRAHPQRVRAGVVRSDLLARLPRAP
jgi:hypothetical protein